MQKNRKGFTIAELVIVIVVIAVLAAVLIPLFANLIERARLSVDQQTVDGMNQVLQIDEILNGKPASLNAAKAVLEDGNYRGNIAPTAKDYEFYWIPAENRVVLVKMNGDTPESVVYPKVLADQYATLPTEWYRLSESSDVVVCPHTTKKYVAVADGNTSTHHMEICSVCSTVTLSSEAHDTTGTDGACSKCGWKTPGDSHEHVYSDYLSDCKGHHWGVCSCGLLGAREDCTYVNGKCEKCGYADPAATGDDHTHQFTYVPVDPYDGRHTRTCTVEGCSIFGETEDCAYGLNKKCIYCGADMPDQGGEHTHSFGAWTSNGNGTHSRSCSCGVHETADCTFVNGVCSVCGYEDRPVEVKITGVAAWSTEADHKDDNGNTIGNTDLLGEHGVTRTGDYRSFHTMTITYTIPAGTPANAKIILEQPTNIKSQLFSQISPAQSFGITYKIINNSGNTYGNISAAFNSNLVETIVKTECIIKLDNGKWICVLNDGTYEELSSNARPLITVDGPFAEYVTWLKNAGKTTYTSVSTDFINEYYSTHSKTEGQRFIDFVETLPDSSTDLTVTTKANVYEKMSGMAGNKAGNKEDDYRHVEGEVIKQMILFQQKSMVGYAFVENKYDANDKTSGWKAVDYKTWLSGSSASEWSYSPIVDWDNLTQSSLKVTSAVDLLASGANLVYRQNGTITTAGAALIWHGFAGNAWQGVAICDFLSLTIVMEK